MYIYIYKMLGNIASGPDFRRTAIGKTLEMGVPAGLRPAGKATAAPSRWQSGQNQARKVDFRHGNISL